MSMHTYKEKNKQTKGYLAHKTRKGRQSNRFRYSNRLAKACFRCQSYVLSPRPSQSDCYSRQTHT